MRNATAIQEEVNDSRPLWREAELLAVDALGQLMEFWGFRRHLGRVWGVLYLSPEPMPVSALADALGLSASGVSLALGELLQWGAIRKTYPPGERRDHYAVEASIWKLIRRVFERRELVQVNEAAARFANADAQLKALRRRVSAADRKRIDYKRRRLAQLRALSVIGERMVRALVAGRGIEPNEIRVAEEQAR